eukprot:1399774-Amphidinium_carterae.1
MAAQVPPASQCRCTPAKPSLRKAGSSSKQLSMDGMSNKVLWPSDACSSQTLNLNTTLQDPVINTTSYATSCSFCSKNLMESLLLCVSNPAGQSTIEAN